jgi:RNA polymerase sigma-70 factor (ECF subfamily)
MDAHYSPTPVAEALALIAQGGAAAERGAQQLFQLFWRKFVNDFVRAGQPLAQAEDLASESFHKILRGISGMRDPVAFPKWAQTIARNTFYSYLRDTRSQREAEIALDSEPLQALYEGVKDQSQLDLPTRLCLKDQLEKFCEAEPERALWLERWIFDGQELAELSTALGRTLGATKEYLSQCRKRLQQYLRKCLI